MWAAHDDRHAPNFISSCLPYLLKDTEAGLCVPKTQAFYRDQVSWISNMKSFSGANTRTKLFGETLRHFPAVGMYGLYRRSIIQKTGLWRNFTGADLVFIQDLTLHGDIVTCNEILFSYYERETWNTLNQDYVNIHGATKKPWFYSPFLIVLGNQISIIVQSENSLFIKMRLLGVLVRYQLGQVARKLTLKLVKIVIPEKYKVSFVSKFYWKFMHNPNIEVINMPAFIERNVMPMIGLR